MYQSGSTKGKRGCLNSIEPLSKRFCSHPQRQSSEEELEEGEYKETPVGSPNKASQEESSKIDFLGANGECVSKQPTPIHSSHSGHEDKFQHEPVSQGVSLEAGEVSAGELDLFVDPDDVTSMDLQAGKGGESTICEAMDLDQSSGKTTAPEEEFNQPTMEEDNVLKGDCGDGTPRYGAGIEDIGLKNSVVEKVQDVNCIQDNSKVGDWNRTTKGACRERDCFEDTGRDAHMDRFQTRNCLGDSLASSAQIEVSVEPSNEKNDNEDAVEPGRSGAVLESVAHRNNGQYGGSGGTSDELDYDSGEADREDSQKLEEGSTGQKGEFSDPFSDIDDSLINVDEEMNACPVPTRVQTSLQQVEAGMTEPEMGLIDVMSPRGMSDDGPPNESMPQRRGAELSNLTSLLSGDRTLGMDGVMVNSGELQDVNNPSEQGSDAFSKLQQGRYTEDVVAGAGTIEHSEEGATGKLDNLAAEDGPPLLLEKTDQDEVTLNGLLPHYSSIDLHDREIISKHLSGELNHDKPGQVFSLLAEYGDDDEDEGDEEKEDEHQEDLSHQDLMKVDDKPVTPPQEARGSAHDHDQGDHCKGEDEAEPDISTTHTKHQLPDLPPHLKMLSKPTAPAEVLQEDDKPCPLSLESSKKVDGGECEVSNDEQKTTCEDLEALLPDEYKDRAEGEVSPSIQETIRNLLEFQQTQNIFFNEEVMANKQFRNPCFLTKMSVHFGIDEFGTELVHEIYNPHNLPREDYADGIRAERFRRASTSQATAPTGGTGASRVMGPPSAPPGVQNAILQGQRRLREKFTSMAAGKNRPSKWDTGQ